MIVIHITHGPCAGFLVTLSSYVYTHNQDLIPSSRTSPWLSALGMSQTPSS